ncbi:RWD domain-containing protein 1-like [Uloborus diversus]|uniref:RWD domain-containing protein 1-like n=1 Tax=Uloborus diversus TaxID=327109 RepID=UPI0024098CC0|nr:RWD domain-containing protein 1-like [Uloborus diversus]
MTDYKEEQRDEIEALESIYPDELKILTQEPEFVFAIDIKTEDVRDFPDKYMAVTLRFCYTPLYPDEAPIIGIEESEEVSEEDAAELVEFLQTKADENLGMVMIFTLVSEASEWLNKKLLDNITRKREADELRIKQLEEEERNRFEGVRVTVESFLSWKAKFDQEMAELRKLQSKNEVSSKRLTGRELFEKDDSLVDSDLQFLQEGEDEVKVDESLFQELDDLELQDEDISN